VQLLQALPPMPHAVSAVPVAQVFVLKSQQPLQATHPPPPSSPTPLLLPLVVPPLPLPPLLAPLLLFPLSLEYPPLPLPPLLLLPLPDPLAASSPTELPASSPRNPRPGPVPPQEYSVTTATASKPPFAEPRLEMRIACLRKRLAHAGKYLR
jgi:hypothetical protein